MADILVSAATGALGPVMGKLVAMLGEEYKRLRKIRTEIISLTKELEAIDAFLKKMAEEEDPNPQDKHWMNEVRELSYDVEDNLDEFMARVVADKSAKPDGLMDKIKGSLKRVKARRDIAKAIEDLKMQTMEVSQRNARYRSGETGASNTSSAHKVDLRAFAIYEDASKLIGVDEPKREIIKLLIDGEATNQQPNVVAIVGSGGLGKTTVAGQVYKEIKGQFDCSAIFSVSRNPDITRVMSNIYCKLNEKYSPGTEDLQTIITKIRDFLENKRYLIVVDDLWKEDDWKAIKCAFPETSSGSKIITTTRINDVARSCCSSSHGHIYSLRPLTMMHSRQLLYTRLFNSEEKCPSNLKEISEQILEKCAGLPMAIIAISGVLADKTSRKDQWEQVKDSVGRALRNSSIETVVNIISLSYLDLPPNLRTCLLYLSIFPEDYIIQKDNLIRRWIGEGFIHKKGGISLLESGELCFNELINRSLIQPAEKEVVGDVETPSAGPNVYWCRVHDTVHDFIVSKAVEENFVAIIGVPGVVNSDPGNNKVRRLSLQNDGEIPPGMVVSHARSLHAFGGSVKIPSLSEFRLLRVLNFEDCGQLDDDDLAGIGTLLHLKYLRFRHAQSVTKLPEELSRLQHVEIDIQEHRRFMEMPESVRQLVTYAAVWLDGHSPMPDEVADMKGLRRLSRLNVYNQRIQFLKRLRQLENLRWLVVLFVPGSPFGDFGDGWEEKQKEGWEEKQKEEVSSISELGKAQLEYLFIFIKNGDKTLLEEEWFPCPESEADEIVLRELFIRGDKLRTVPEWIASLVNLEKLTLPMSSMGEKDVKILGALPSLRSLDIDFDSSYEDYRGPEYEARLRRAFQAHPNRPTLEWRYM